jgi:hypothetical protein
MDKFLDLVEDHTPDDSIGRNTEIKVMIYQTLTDQGIAVENRQFTNFLVITDDKGNKYKVSIDNIEDAEDQETETANTTKDVELAAATAKKGVSGAIAGAMGTVAQKAKKAVERRKKVIKAQLPKKIAEYEAATNELEK